MSTGATSALLGTYDRDAVLVSVNGTASLAAEPEVWAGTGGSVVAGATLAYSVEPASLGTVSSTGEFTAGPLPGNGTVRVTASLNGTTATSEVGVVVYAPHCLLATTGLEPQVPVAAGEILDAPGGLLDQTGQACANAPIPTWSLWPAAVGTLTPSVGGSAQVNISDSAPGSGWLSVVYVVNGTPENATTHLTIEPYRSGLGLMVSPANARLLEGGLLSLTATLTDPLGVAPSATYTWTTAGTALAGSLSSSGGDAELTAGSSAGPGWVNVTAQVLGLGTWTGTVPVTVLAPPSTVAFTGIYTGQPNIPPLEPGATTSLSAYPEDPYGGFDLGEFNVTWTVDPAGLATVSGSGPYPTITAGPTPGVGVVTATVSAPGQTNVSASFGVEVVPLGLTDVVLPGDGSSHVAGGSSIILEAVPQDLDGNLLLDGTYFGFSYPGWSTTWQLAPSSLGTVTSYGGTSGPDTVLEAADFNAGEVNATGQAWENVSWGGVHLSIVFPLQVQTSGPVGVVMGVAGGSGPLGTVSPGSTGTLEASVIDGRGDILPTGGTFSWVLDAGSDGTLTAGADSPEATVAFGAVAGEAQGTLHWSDGSAGVEVRFIVDVSRAPVASFVTLEEGGALGIADEALPSAELLGGDLSPLIVTSGSLLTFGTSEVPNGTEASWSISPGSWGRLQVGTGNTSSVTVGGTGGLGWLNASYDLPGGSFLNASLLIAAFTPVLSGLELSSGPCATACPNGLATFTDNAAFAGVLPVGQDGETFSTVTWNATLSPSDLGSVAVTSWTYQTGAALVAVTTSGTPGSGSLTVTASSGGTNVTVTIALQVILSTGEDELPSAPTNLSAEAGEETAYLSWNAPETGGVILGYEIAAAPTGAIGVPVDQAVGNVTTFALGGLDDNVTYSVTVRAENAEGLSPPSAAVLVTPTNAPPTAPGVPQNLSSELADLQVSVRWDAPASSGSSPLSSYTYTLMEVGGGLSGSGEVAASGPNATHGGSFVFTFVGTKGATYKFEVDAENEQGLVGPWSPVLTITIPAPQGSSLPLEAALVGGTVIVLLFLVGVFLVLRRRPAPNRPQPGMAAPQPWQNLAPGGGVAPQAGQAAGAAAGESPPTGGGDAGAEPVGGATTGRGGAGGGPGTP